MASAFPDATTELLLAESSKELAKFQNLWFAFFYKICKAFFFCLLKQISTFGLL